MRQVKQMQNNTVDIKKMEKKLSAIEKAMDTKALEAVVVINYLESNPDNAQDFKDMLAQKKARFLRIRDEL